MKTYKCLVRCYGFSNREWLPEETLQVDEEAEQELLSKHPGKFEEVPQPSSQSDADELKVENQSLREELESLKEQVNKMVTASIKGENRGPGRPPKNK